MATAKRVKSIEHEDVLVPFNKLHFDPMNPRGEPENDEEKIRALFGVESETAVLAAHLAEHGQNPLDRLGIVDHSKLPGHFVIREGNRRLCAMQLLRDPERAPTPAARRTFLRLAANARPIPDQVQAVLFHQQPKARVWMSVKHEGPQNGLGTLTWGSKQKARFNREGDTGNTRPKNPNRQAEALLTYAVAQKLITPEERALIAITTITRYLPNVRSALALLNTEDCTTNATREEFDAALHRFFKDTMETGASGGQSEVHSRSASAERNAYAEKFRSEGHSPNLRTRTPYDPSRRPLTSAADKTPIRARSVADPGKRKQLISSNFAVAIKDPILLRLVKEGKELNPDEARFSCNYINRVVLERVIHQYVKKHGVGGQGEFSEVVQRAILHAKASNEPPSKGIALVLTKAADKKTMYSYESMSNAVHGGSIPSGADNRSNWESLQPALEYLLSRLK